MRIGTWNLQGRWDGRQLVMIQAMDCDVLLLTEVRDGVEIPGMSLHMTQLDMTRGRRWAAIASRTPPEPLPDPHGASAMAKVEGLRFCSSVLPWNGCRPDWPFSGNSEAEWTAVAVSAIETAAPDVWGGDWNHTLGGTVSYGSDAGRDAIASSAKRLRLSVATAMVPGRDEELRSIDHIAVPTSWTVKAVDPYVAALDGKRLSDHDAYVVETV